MPAPEFEVLVALTRTGQVVDSIVQPDWDFEEYLAWGTLGKLDVTVPLPGVSRAGALTRSTLRSIATAGSAMSLALVRDGVALAAGPVYTLGWDDTEVKIGCASLNKLFDKRMIMNPDYLTDPTNPAADLTLSLQPRDLAIQLLATAMTGARRGLPLSLPTDLSASTGDPVTYAGVDLRSAYEAVKAVVEADGGPDVLLLPQISDDKSQLSWTAAVGNPTLGGAVNPDAVWDYPVAVASGDIDDSETTEIGYVVGDSTGTDSSARIIGVANNPRGEPYPALERADRTTVSEARQSQLDALATSYGAEYGQPVETISYTAPADVAPLYRIAWNLGDIGTFTFTGHPWLDDGTKTARIIGVSMDQSNSLTFTTAA